MNNSYSHSSQTRPALRHVLLVSLLTVVGLFALTQSASAQSEPDGLPHWLYMPQVAGSDSLVSKSDAFGNADIVSGAMCMQQEAGFTLQCTANDISIANATNITILDDGCAYPGDTVTFKADFRVQLTAEARHDVGLWFAADGDPNGDGALTGQCTAATPAYAPDPPWLDLDGTDDPLPKDNKPSGIQDTCGDIDDDHNPLFPSVTLTVMCIDTDANGKLELPNCTSWRQPGDNDLCTTAQDAVPGAPSKCKCDRGFDIDIPVPGQIIVDKVTVPADATLFNFTLTGGPGSANIPFSLADASTPFASQFLFAGVYSVVESPNTSYGVKATCSDGSPANAISLQPGETVKCIFTNTLLEGPPSIQVTKTANPTSVSEPGGSVNFTVEIKNTSDATDPVTITSLTDDVHGDLHGQGGCSVPQTIEPGATYSCSFTANVTGVPGYSEKDIVTASGVDNENTPVSSSDDATVTITNVPSTINVVKTADPTSVSEPGGNVIFSFVVDNTSLVDAVTINTLSDSIYGNLHGQGDCSVPQTLPVGGSYSCSISVAVSGQPGDEITNVVTASGLDDDGQPVSNTDDAMVTINDVPSSIEMVKTANPGTVNEPGGDVTFTFEVMNTSDVDAVTIHSLTDTVFGDLNGQGNCSVPQTIAAKASYSCSITVPISGNAGVVHTNTAAVYGTDDDGNPLSDSDDASVTVNDIPSSIELLKTADLETVNEPGGSVTFSFVVRNLSTVDTVTINNLSDNIYLDLTAAPGSTCAVPQVLPPSQSYSCSITVFVGGNAGDVHTNIATAAGVDDDGQVVGDDDSATVTVNNVQGAIEVVKTASPTSVSEPGGNVEYTIIVYNLSTIDAVTLNSLTDSVFGDLNGKGNCLAPQPIAASSSYTCKFTGAVTGNAGAIHTNVVTASGVDDDGDPVSDIDDETVMVTDVPSSIELVKTASAGSVDEPGANITFSFEVKNTSAVDAVNITSLIDSVYGDLNGQGSCVLPEVIPAGQSYLCSFTTFVGGNAGASHTNVATASGKDDDGNDVSATDDETVLITDVPSSIMVTKSASPGSVPETGGDVLFEIVVENTSLVDSVRIDSVVDSIFGDVSGFCTPLLPANLAPNGSVTCSFITFISGDAGQTHLDVATGSGTDDDGNPVEDDDQVEIPFVDVLPDITVTKTADPLSVPETGGNAIFTFVVTNNSAEAATISSLSDDKFGALAGDADCQVGAALAGGASCTFSAVLSIPAGDYPGSHVNTFTATVTDGDGNSATDTDDETVAYTDVLPDITVTKTADPASVPETGGDVTFTFVVTNNSAEAAEITALSDDKFGALTGDAGCQVGTMLAGGASCTFSAVLSIPAGDFPGSHMNTFTAAVIDDDSNSATDTDDETVAYLDVLPDITVTKTADPASVPETGGDVTFTFVVTNNSAEAAEITALSDDKFGALTGDADCQAGTVLAGGASCSFSAVLSIPAGDVPGSHVNTFTATVKDDEGNTDTDADDETVAYTDVAGSILTTKTANPTSVPETGGLVEFMVRIDNTSAVDAVTINTLNDDVYGSLDGVGTCDVPQTIAVDGYYECFFSATVAGDYPDSHVDVVTASGTDEDGQPVSDDDDATVTISDVPSSIMTTKTADPASVPETGGDVTFTIEVQNTSPADSVTIESVIDDIFGDVSASCAPALPVTLAKGETVRCSFTWSISGEAGGTHTNVATASGKDDDNHPVSDTDDETVTLTDVLPDITVTKTADPASVPETGGDVTFTFVVTNNGAEAATVSNLSDSVYGMLDGDADCQAGTVLAAGASCQFSITRFVSGDFSGDDHSNVFTGAATDNDGNEDSDTDDETVTLTDVLPDITVTKTADPASVPETGGDVTFTFVVTNNGAEAATVSNLSDSVYGMLDGDADCQAGTVLAAGASCQFSITRFVSGDFSGDDHNNVFTGAATDNDGNEDSDTDDETVTLTDVLPDITVTKTADPASVPETGGDVTFTFVVTNNGAEAATVSNLSDSVYGMLDGDADCQAGTVLAAGASCQFSITRFVSGDFSGDDHSNVFTGAATDNDGNEDSDTDDETVTLTDVLPDITVTKTADPASVPETGGDVTFTFVVTNNGAEAATVSNLSDSVYGMLDGDADCQAGTVLAAGASCQFSITRFVSGDFSGDDHNNVFTGAATDNDGNEDSDTDDETVTFTDVLPDITVTKTADPASVPETGGDVTFTFVVTNNGAEAATVSNLSDSVYGMLDGDADCQAGTVLAAGASCQFSITRFVSGDFSGDDHSNVFTGAATDNDGNEDSDTDDETVTLTDVLPDITVTKTADPASVPETGGIVTFTFVVTNNGAEAATVSSLSDDKFGALAGDADCQVGTVLAGGASCTFSATFSIPASDYPGSHVNVFTAVAGDDDGNSASATDDATVTSTDRAPAVTIVKTVDANADGIFKDSEPLQTATGEATYKYQVTNTSPASGFDPLTIDTLVDDRGTADASDDKLLVSGGVLQSGVTLVKSGGDQDGLLESGETWTYTWTAVIPVNAATPNNTNTATVTAHDDEGTSATDDDTASVNFIDYGQIAPTGIVCDQYVNGTAQDFSNYYAAQGGVVQYGVKSNKINSTNPGVFFYYTGLSKTIAGSGPRTVYIDQSDNSSIVGAFTATKNDVKLWLVTGGKCTQVQLQSSQITLLNGPNAGDVQVSFTAAAPAGSYYVVSVKYSTASVIGANLGAARPTVKYTFTTDVGKDGSIEETDTKGITLAPKVLATSSVSSGFVVGEHLYLPVVLH